MSMKALIKYIGTLNSAVDSFFKNVTQDVWQFLRFIKIKVTGLFKDYS